MPTHRGVNIGEGSLPRYPNKHGRRTAVTTRHGAVVHDRGNSAGDRRRIRTSVCRCGSRSRPGTGGCGHTGRKMTLVACLPAWIKRAKNRDEILRAVSRPAVRESGGPSKRQVEVSQIGRSRDDGCLAVGLLTQPAIQDRLHAEQLGHRIGRPPGALQIRGEQLHLGAVRSEPSSGFFSSFSGAALASTPSPRTGCGVAASSARGRSGAPAGGVAVPVDRRRGGALRRRRGERDPLPGGVRRARGRTAAPAAERLSARHGGPTGGTASTVADRGGQRPGRPLHQPDLSHAPGATHLLGWRSWPPPPTPPTSRTCGRVPAGSSGCPGGVHPARVSAGAAGLRRRLPPRRGPPL